MILFTHPLFLEHSTIVWSRVTSYTQSKPSVTVEVKLEEKERKKKERKRETKKERKEERKKEIKED